VLEKQRALHDARATNALVFATEDECEAAVRRSLSNEASSTSMRPTGWVDGIVCDPFVATKLRPHQREGSKWMYRALHGLDDDRGDSGRRGVVLADEMGLGKSLQVLAVLWTMLKQGPSGNPTCRRAVLVCPASLVGNWGDEFKKWLGGVRAQASLAEGNTESIAAAVDRWCSEPAGNSKSSFDKWPVLVMSYETARRFAGKVAAMKPELMVCDEAHRLRNASGSQTLSALRDIDAPMRILLTGTPIQNNLNEYAAVLDFAQPGLLGPLEDFQRSFTIPIQRQYEKGASKRDVEVGLEAAAELKRRTAGKILSRKASTNAAYLPPKLELLVLCQPTPTQRMAYEAGAKLVETWTSKDNSSSSGAAALCAIGILRQAANEVDQVLDGKAISQTTVEDDEENFENDRDANTVIQSSTVEELKRVMRDSLPSTYTGGVEGSAKFAVLENLLSALANREDTTERIVLVSGYSASLDTADMICKKIGLTTSRLDGTVAVDLRTSIVKNFNSGSGGRVMLLSVVAGGAGLNLVGANRLVLMDVSWNPAHDRQAMARIWRDGQTKPVTIYRLITSGTVEQKVFERQLSKEVLKNTVEVGYSGYDGDGFTTRESLRKLVQFKNDDSVEDVTWGERVELGSACPLLSQANLNPRTCKVVRIPEEAPRSEDQNLPKQKENVRLGLSRKPAPKRGFDELFPKFKRP
jgi:SNF2 family DNA or RNA helicase